MSNINRREFLKTIGKIGAGAFLVGAGCSSKKKDRGIVKDSTIITEKVALKPAYLAVVKGNDPASITKKAIETVGGISRFVKKGFDVIVKPNICTDYYSYEYAATTNPIVVSTIVSLCISAGARRVRVMDNTIRGSGNANKGYRISGIQAAVEKAGGVMEIMNPIKYKETSIPYGKQIKSWPIYSDILKADAIINVPIPKDHPATELTIGCKNLMGIIDKPTKFHDRYLHQRIADLASVVIPTLTVVDAVRILMHNGPTGGSLSDVKFTNTVIASHDMIAADAYAASLFFIKGKDIEHIRSAGEMGLGITDLNSIDIKEIEV